MTDLATFRCSALNREMTVSRCARNQREAEEYFGTQPPKKGSCHLCEKGQEMRNGKGEEMQKEKKACRNCGRMKTVVADGLCWVCYAACRWLTKGSEEYNDALEAVKEKLKRGEIREKIKKAAQGEKKAENITGTGGREPLTLLINIEVNVKAIRVG